LNCQNVAKHADVFISFQSCKALFETPCITQIRLVPEGLREDRRLRVIEDMVLKRMEVTGDGRKM
jgi:hypothetical protein